MCAINENTLIFRHESLIHSTNAGEGLCARHFCIPDLTPLCSHRDCERRGGCAATWQLMERLRGVSESSCEVAELRFELRSGCPQRFASLLQSPCLLEV